MTFQLFILFFFQIQTFTFALILLALSCCQLVATFGYDSGGSCEPRGARKGRAQLISSIPCDLTKQAYCNLPGTLYPWHAVRRFVHENQGLMKRMYGDTRHLSILKNEFEENYIEEDKDNEDDATIALERYGGGAAGNGKSGRTMKVQVPGSATSADKKNRRTDIQEPHFRLQSANKSSSSSSSSTSTSTQAPNITKSDYEVETNLVLNSSNPGILDEIIVTTPTAKQEFTTVQNDSEEEDVVGDLKSSSPTMEGQLFQDTLRQPPAANVRGV